MATAHFPPGLADRAAAEAACRAGFAGLDVAADDWAMFGYEVVRRLELSGAVRTPFHGPLLCWGAP